MIKQTGTGVFVLMIALQVFGWGSKGHQIVASVGASVTSVQVEFWQSNSDSLSILSTVPDRVWKSLPTASLEKPTHYFEMDRYVDWHGTDILSFPKSYEDAKQKYGESVLIENGTATWRIRQFYNLAVGALKAKDFKLAIEYVGVMSHYVADLAQPLHVTENYDGQMTGNKGIHKFFETDNIDNVRNLQTDVQQRAQKLLQSSEFRNHFTGDIMDIIYYSMWRSIQDKDAILNADTQYGRQSGQGQKAMLEIAKNRLADGAATYAMILDKASKESGLSVNQSQGKIKDPRWVAISYCSADCL